MMRRGPELADRGPVLGRSVPLVRLPPVFRVPTAQTSHQAIPGDLCHDRGTGDGVAPQIAANDGRVLTQTGHALAIHEKKIGLERKVLKRAAHCERGGVPSVQALDFSTGSGGDAVRQAVLLDNTGELFPSLGAQ